MAPPILLLLLLHPGCFCYATTPSCGRNNCTVSPPPSPFRQSTEHLTVTTNASSTAPSCPPGVVTVDGGPTSRTGNLGDNISLECVFNAPSGAQAQVTWYRVCPSQNCGHPGEVEVAGKEPSLIFSHLTHNDTGLYFCRVEAGRGIGQSCGTFLRVREPKAVPFLNIKEATKNRIITAEGVLLLLCAVGPGLLLLFRKRWANERLLQMKKALEEENLYEGLNLDECSMYEDISRGLQPTYQDVGSLHPADPQLEKP
ncbi:B-cell antigen receptor complex-associated protein alpha chain isoform X2 [Chroicocephalus ridibundus]|uniref:B-cell antigen receptor complex-associated protein alpha chain isoform X2 n=1 Tax=Chroicocephalus ridibundus TaxID=1192867 RepID=UPI002FDE2430